MWRTHFVENRVIGAAIDNDGEPIDKGVPLAILTSVVAAEDESTSPRSRVYVGMSAANLPAVRVSCRRIENSTVCSQRVRTYCGRHKLNGRQEIWKRNRKRKRERLIVKECDYHSVMSMML